MSRVKVRFAPSPTGYLHVGSARTALFNWLFARHEGGEFVLRIEDTDKARSKEEYLEEILESLKWLGLDWDGELHFQSKRAGLYIEYSKTLLNSGAAYEKEGALHLRMPQGKLKINDIIHGDIEFDTALIKDQVLIKSDGFPTYNFACVIDDSTMGVTHVIRGDDHISNTPKQVVMYNALGMTPPRFCHLPLILGLDRSRLSKRHGATSIRDYREEGFLPEALVNYLCLLGWSLGKDKEIFSIEEAVKGFSLDGINKTAAVFDINKLLWINGQRIKNLDLDKLTQIIAGVLKKEGLLSGAVEPPGLKRIVALYQQRIRTPYDFADMAKVFFSREAEYDEEAVNKYLKDETTFDILRKINAKLKALKAFDAASLENCVRMLAAELGIKAAGIIHPVRAAVTGKTVGAGLFEILELLGRDKTVENIENAVNKFKPHSK